MLLRPQVTGHNIAPDKINNAGDSTVCHQIGDQNHSLHYTLCIAQSNIASKVNWCQKTGIKVELS